MRESRRAFLGLAVGVAASAAAAAAPQFATPQDPSVPVPPPPTPPPPRKRNLRAELRDNQVSIKKDVTKLSELVAELQKGLNDSDTKEVLSLDVIHKAEEIEKLARQIRDLVRG